MSLLYNALVAWCTETLEKHPEMYLHLAELNVVAVTENVNTFPLVWTHVSRYGVIVFRCIRLHANGRNNSQHCWDLQCIVGRIQPVSLCKPCVMSVRGPNNVGRAVQTDPTLLRYASAITEQKKCWELLAEKFDLFQTLRNNTQQYPKTCNRVCKGTQHVTFNNVGSCWSTMLRPFALR